MGNLFGGGESKSNTVTNQTYTANPLIAQTAGTALGKAAAAADTPFNLPQQGVAGFSPLQLQAFNQYQAIQGQSQPFFNTANNLYQQSASPLSASDINQYYIPYADKVFAAMENAQGAESKRAMGSAIARAGGVGADRLAVTQANLAQKHELDTGATAANLYQQAVQAVQADRQRQGAAAAGLGQLGGQSLQARLAETGALSGAGGQQQGLEQQQMNSLYNYLVQQAAYPYQQAQYLAGITGGLAPAMGGTTAGTSQTTSTPASPSIFSQIAGLGLAGAGLMMGGIPGLGISGLGSVMGGSGGGSATMGSVPVGNYNMPTVGYNPYPMYGYKDGGGVDDDEETPDGIGVSANRGGAYPRFDIGGDTSSPWSGLKVEPGQSMWDFIKANPIPGMGGNPTAAAPVPAAAPTPDPMNSGAYPAPAPSPVIPRVPIAPPRQQPRSMATNIEHPPTPEDSGLDVNSLPYPDATKRDWGQNMTRSPWMALVEAGATMASTPGGIGTSLGRGLLAGAKSLDKQRGELRSEEEINNRARALYQNAKQHLDQYNKMTPYQRASLALRNRELDQNEGTGGSETSSRAFHARALQYYKLLKADVNNLRTSDAELQKKAYEMARGASGASSPGAGGDSAATALPDPGPGGRIKGKWYIGPSGQPQQWLQ